MACVSPLWTGRASRMSRLQRRQSSITLALLSPNGNQWGDYCLHFPGLEIEVWEDVSLVRDHTAHLSGLNKAPPTTGVSPGSALGSLQPCSEDEPSRFFWAQANNDG